MEKRNEKIKYGFRKSSYRWIEMRTIIVYLNGTNKIFVIKNIFEGWKIKKDLKKLGINSEINANDKIN